MKTTQEMIAVMQAFVDGKIIEFYDPSDKMWYVTDDHMWDWANTDYRIKPEPQKPKIVPYESAEEFLAAMKEHGPMIKCGSIYYQQICSVNLDSVLFSVDVKTELIQTSWLPFSYLTEYTWQDGTPCGKEIIE